MFSCSRYETKAGNAPDAYGAAITFTNPSRILEVTIWDQPAVLSLSYDGVTFGNDIEKDPGAEGFPYQIFYQCKAFKIKNKVAGNVARYQVIGWS